MLSREIFVFKYPGQKRIGVVVFIIVYFESRFVHLCILVCLKSIDLEAKRAGVCPSQSSRRLMGIQQRKVYLNIYASQSRSVNQGQSVFYYTV